LCPFETRPVTEIFRGCVQKTKHNDQLLFSGKVETGDVGSPCLSGSTKHTFNSQKSSIHIVFGAMLVAFDLEQDWRGWNSCSWTKPTQSTWEVTDEIPWHKTHLRGRFPPNRDVIHGDGAWSQYQNRVPVTFLGRPALLLFKSYPEQVYVLTCVP
jgi:hypothetical protein